MLKCVFLTLQLAVLVFCQLTLPPVIHVRNSSSATCPTQQMRQEVMRTVSATVSNLLQNAFLSLPQCGVGMWHPVVNFGAAEDGCPSAWSSRIFGGSIACGRPESPSGDCVGVSFSAGRTSSYSKVCGRVTGRGINSPDGFNTGQQGIDAPYIDGVSVTTTDSSPRVHIWSFVATIHSNCRCDSMDVVGSNYFCDHISRPLWNAERCTGSNSPYFTADLPSPTTDDIEVRICTDQNTADENIFIESLELYTQ